MSSSEDTPPEAMTGIRICRATAAIALASTPIERPVAGDVGVDDRCHAAILEAARQLDDADLGGLRPALDRDTPVPRVDADDDPARVIGGGMPHKPGIAQRRGAEHHAVDAERQPMLDRGAVADPAAELDRQIDGPADRRNRRAVHRAAGEGAVKIDDMQPGEAGICEMASLRRRIVG